MIYGKLLLVTNTRDLVAQEVVARYKSLADIGRGFKVLKSELGIGPVYHRLPERALQLSQIDRATDSGAVHGGGMAHCPAGVWAGPVLSWTPRCSSTPMRHAVSFCWPRSRDRKLPPRLIKSFA